jgi:hypothetical protein
MLLSDGRHRIAPRLRVLKAGTISFAGGAIDCTVRNISETGAKLEVASPLYFPDRFTPVTRTALVVVFELSGDSTGAGTPPAA